MSRHRFIIAMGMAALLGAFVATLVVALGASSQPPGFCQRHPHNPNCPTTSSTSSSTNTTTTTPTTSTTTPTTTTTPTPDPTLAIPGISLIQYGYPNAPQATLGRYSAIMMSPYRADCCNYDLAYVKSLSPTTKVLAYTDESSAKRNCINSIPLRCGTVTYEEALAHDNANPNDQWLLRDASGAVMVPNSIYPDDYLVNMGSASYQARALAVERAGIAYTASTKGYKFDGLMYDNTTINYGWRTSGRTGYINGVLFTQQNWHDAQLSFLRNVSAALRSDGSYIEVNSGVVGDQAGDQTIAWWNEIAPYVDNLEMEYFESGGNGDGVVFFNDPTDWHGFYNGWLRIVGVAQSLGKDVTVGGHGSTTDTAQMMYVKAAFLLGWNGRAYGSMYWMQTSGTDPWNPAWTTQIGVPSAPKYAVSTGWRRDYTKGTVLVNPNRSGGASIAFDLGGSYKTPSGSTVTSITLSPVTAMILTR